MCDECERELHDKANRRFEYPFITCVSCGPRFSIIKNLPYDRKNSSMDEFVMCEECKEEYENPKDRRYHAQPIGCHKCGPKLSLFDNSGAKIESNNLIDEVISAISEGKIVAIKGIGGYHLLCDASNDSAVTLLRERKKRPSKPFGVMVKDIDTSKHIAHISEKEQTLLSSNRRPIVLLQKRDENLLSRYVAPNINQIGLFLAYTPLHPVSYTHLTLPTKRIV